MAKKSGGTRSAGSSSTSASRTVQVASALNFSANSIIKEMGTYTPSVRMIADYFEGKGFKVINNYEDVAQITTPSGNVMIMFHENNPKYSSDSYRMDASVLRVNKDAKYYEDSVYKEKDFNYLRSGTYYKNPDIDIDRLQAVIDFARDLDDKISKKGK